VNVYVVYMYSVTVIVCVSTSCMPGLYVSSVLTSSVDRFASPGWSSTRSMMLNTIVSFSVATNVPFGDGAMLHTESRNIAAL